MSDNELLQALSDILDKKLEEKLSQILDEKLQPIYNRLEGMEGRLDRVEGRLDKLESQVSALKAGQLDLRKEIKALEVSISKTYDLALDAWGTGKENRKWLEKIN